MYIKVIQGYVCQQSNNIRKGALDNYDPPTSLSATVKICSGKNVYGGYIRKQQQASA